MFEHERYEEILRALDAGDPDSDPEAAQRARDETIRRNARARAFADALRELESIPAGRFAEARRRSLALTWGQRALQAGPSEAQLTWRQAADELEKSLEGVYLGNAGGVVETALRTWRQRGAEGL